MKKYLVIVFVVVFALVSCDSKKEKFNPREEIAAIENVLDQYVIANENQDFSIIERIWAEEDDIAMIGTDSDELLVGWHEIRAAIQHQFEAFENTYVSVNNQKIHLSETGQIAWFYETLNYNFIYNGEAMSFEGIRFTGVLKKNNGNWEIVQGHLSIPAEVDLEEE